MKIELHIAPSKDIIFLNGETTWIVELPIVAGDHLYK